DAASGFDQPRAPQSKPPFGHNTSTPAPANRAPQRNDGPASTPSDAGSPVASPMRRGRRSRSEHRRLRNAGGPSTHEIRRGSIGPGFGHGTPRRYRRLQLTGGTTRPGQSRANTGSPRE